MSSRCRAKCRGLKHQTRDEARSIHQVLRSYRGDRNFLDQSTKCQGGVEITIRKSLEARRKARCRKGAEKVSSKLLKTVFRKEKNIDMNAIKHATQPMIQNTILTSQNHLSIAILSTWISKK